MGVINERAPGLHGRGVNLVTVTLIFTTVALALVTARVTTRMFTGRKLHNDDYAIMASMVFSVGLGIANCIAVDHGYGKAAASLPPNDLLIALQSFWALQILYKFTINLTKTSILFLYLRVFAPRNTTATTFRRTVYGVLIYVLGYAISSIVATIVQCTPISRTFNHNIKGRCINLTAFWYANAVANIVGDLFILGLPMPVVNRLHLPRRQKLGLMMVFALGGFVCVTSILRMTTLNPSSKANDQTYGTLISTIWTTIEANTGIICASLPMLKSPLALLFPRLFPRDSRRLSSSERREASAARRSSTNATAYSGWDRLESDKKAGPPIPSPTVTGTFKGTWPRDSNRSSDDEIFGMGDKDVPMGTITKTTDVRVHYGEGQESRTASSSSESGPKKGGDFSKAHLVGGHSYDLS